VGQVLQDLEPTVLAYWPGAHESQLSEPASLEKVPKGLHKEGGGGGEAGQAAARDVSTC